MPLVDLQLMEDTVRRMTARYTPQQMTKNQIYKYINLAYTLHLPLEFKNSKLTKPYTFLTVPNVDTYPFPYQNDLLPGVPGNIEIEPPVFCQGYNLLYYQDKTNFYNRWPKLSSNQIVGTANGETNFQYTGTITSFPFLRAQLDIFGDVTEANVIISCFDDSGFNFSLTDVPQDDLNIGNLVDKDGVSRGTVNYLNGNYQFTATLPENATIYASAIPYQPARPIEVLFYNQQIVLRPVPAEIYQMEFQISQQPVQLIAANDMPELEEWYLLICAIAAKLIYADFPDPEGLAILMPTYDEQLLKAQRRSLRQMKSQRAQTIFSTNIRNITGFPYGYPYIGS